MWQGPAIYCWNDQTFSPADFTSISKVTRLTESELSPWKSHTFDEIQPLKGPTATPEEKGVILFIAPFPHRNLFHYNIKNFTPGSDFCAGFCADWAGQQAGPGEGDRPLWTGLQLGEIFNPTWEVPKSSLLPRYALCGL